MQIQNNGSSAGSSYNDRKRSSGKRYLLQDNGQMSKKLKLENKSLFKNWLEIPVRDVTDFLVRRFQTQSV